MSARALAQSPVARRLFELSERRADGTLEVGGRTIALRAGRIVDVSGSDSDETLVEFMVRAGRIDAGLAEEASRRARAKKLEFGKALASVGVRAAELRSARRAMFLDRLVRGLGQAELDPSGPAAFVPDATHAESDEDEDLPMLVLDALERRAGEFDAGLVGERASELVHFSDGVFLELARKYVNQSTTDKPPAVFEILRRSPAAASRIAALVRAGLVSLQSDQVAAPPPKRPRSLVPAPISTSIAPRGPIATTASEGPRFRDTLRPGTAPSREPVMRLEPGMTALEPHIFADAGELPEIPAFVEPLSDALDAPERAVAQLEQAQARGRDRANAWLAFGRAWLRVCASIDEAARCAREAAAADATNLVALRESTHLCAAMGRLDLARAYARAAVHYATDDEAKSEGLLDLARLAERDGDFDAALASLEEATRFPTGSIEAWQRLAQLAYGRSDVERAVRAAVGAAEASMGTDPTIARAWAEWAQMLAGNAGAASVEARAIDRLGRPVVASAILAARARSPFDVATRQRLLVESAELAERGGRNDVAFARVLDAHFADVTMDALFDALATYGERGLGKPAYAALLEHIAVVAPDSGRRDWLDRAASAFERVGTASAWALELRTRALLAEPTSDDAVAELRAHAERAREPASFADAIERLIRTEGLDAALVERRAIELADFCENVLGSAARALWAAERANSARASSANAQRIERIAPRVRIGDNLLAMAEAELDAASDADRPAIARRVAGLLRDAPEARDRAIDLYRNLLAEDPTDGSAALGLEKLLALVGQDEELRLLFAARATDEHATVDRERRLRHWSGLAAFSGERDDVLAASEAWLAAEPSSAEAALRLDLAARLAGDLDLRRAAYEHRVEAATSDSERAIMLVERGLLERLEGDPNATIAFADEARMTDSGCVDALVVLLEELPRIEPRAALEVVETARVVLGDTPQILLVGADLATTIGDDARRKAFLDARRAIAQDAPACAQIGVDRSIEEDDPGAILAAAQQALSRDAIVAGTPLVIERALEAIAKHDAGDAATVAIHAADRLGESRFAELALRYAEQSGLGERLVASYERWVAWSSGGARCIHLRSLAAVHAENGNRAAEARTWLRLLADDPKANDAIDRLATIYSETRDAERLLAVLALRLESASSDEVRERCLLHLAAASAVVVEDVDRAEGFLRRLVSESSDPTATVARCAAALVQWKLPERAIEWLERYAENAADEPAELLFAHAAYVAEEVMHSPERTLELSSRGLERFPGSTSLLLAFERAALTTKRVDDAKRIYTLVEDRAVGEHGRRGFVYRRARFLERAGDKEAALDAYLSSFALAPSEGVVLQAIERLATALGRSDKLVDATLMLIERTAQLDRRLVLLRNVATICEHKLNDPGRAFGLVFEFWKSTQRSDLLPDVRRLARGIAATDPKRAEAATSEIIETLTTRVDDAWDAEDQVRCLRIIAAIEHDDRGRSDIALFMADRGISVGEANRDDIDTTETAELACDAAEWLITGKEEARALPYFERAARLKPELERVRAMGRLLGMRPSLVPASDAPNASPQETNPSPQETIAAGDSMAAAARAASNAPDGITSAIDPLRARADAGDPDAIEELAAGIADDPERAAERCTWLRRLVRADPSRASTYPALVEAARLAGHAVLADTAATVAAIFDDAISSPASSTAVPRVASVSNLVRTPGEARLRTTLALLWETVVPMQRRTFAHYGLTTSERIAADDDRPANSVFQDLSAILGASDVSLFVRDEAPSAVAVLPTQPQALLVRSDVEQDANALRVYLARALAESSNDCAFVHAFPDDQGRGMLSAIVAAFGPPDHVRSISREAAAVAAELWQVVPHKRQDELRAAISTSSMSFDWDVAIDVAHRIAARAALATSPLAHVLDAMFRFEPGGAETIVSSYDGFSAFVASNRALSATIREAFEDDILETRRQ